MTQPQGAATTMLVPSVLTLRVTPQVFELIRGQLGKLPHDEIGGLCQNLEAQAQEQIRAYNEPKTGQIDKLADAMDSANSPVGRAVRRAAAKKGDNVRSIKKARSTPAANT